MASEDYEALIQERDAARAEVERLWAKVAAIIRWPNDGPVPTEDNILPALTGLLASIPAYQAEVKRWKERVTTLETEEKWEALKQAEAALAQAEAENERLRADVNALRYRDGGDVLGFARQCAHDLQRAEQAEARVAALEAALEAVIHAFHPKFYQGCTAPPCDRVRAALARPTPTPQEEQ